MDATEFRRCGKELIDFIADYLEGLHTREVVPNVQPDYLREHVPDTPPEEPQSWEDVMEDVKNHILKGTTHWLHPKFNAYFPIGISYASILADLLSSCLGVGFTWRANPALTELERLVLDWLARMTGMPDHFLNASGVGGGSLQGSASDCVLVSMLAAKKEKLHQLGAPEAAQLPRLVAYCSQLAHSCVEKAAAVACVQLRKLPYDAEDMALQCDELERLVREDRRDGLEPFYVCAVLGTTACASCDSLPGICRISQREGLWCHVDAAYAGSAFVCEEFRHFLSGIEHVDSFNFNASKWLLCTFDTSILWVKCKEKLHNAMTAGLSASSGAEKILPNDQICDLKDWGIPLSRRFRALKPWFVVRLYGVKKLREHIRKHCQLAQRFRTLLEADDRFQIAAKTHFSLVCFRFRNSDALSRLLVCSLNRSRDLHLMPACVCDQYVIRFAIVRERAEEADVVEAIAAIRRHADQLDSKTSQDVINASQRMGAEPEDGWHVPTTEANYTSDDLIVGLSEENYQRKWRGLFEMLNQERGGNG